MQMKNIDLPLHILGVTRIMEVKFVISFGLKNLTFNTNLYLQIANTGVHQGTAVENIKHSTMDEF